MLRRQHDAAVALVETITASIRKYRDTADAYEISLNLAKLNGLLRIHFAQEDRSLYPAMRVSPDPEVAATAEAFQQEMGDLGQAFATYVGRWGTSSAIAAQFVQFRDESAAVFGALANRIERENHNLYPLADAMTEGVRPAA